MNILVGVVSVLFILVVLWDGFETIVLPRRVKRRFRLTRLFYRVTWSPWSALARRVPEGEGREDFLSYYGPLALLFLLVFWAVSLIAAFGSLQWALGSALQDPIGSTDFLSDLYVSGTTFVTLGLGDVFPRSQAARALMAVEGGLGFGFLALVIGYLPVLYQAFSRREVNISLLDARAGSPPTAVELLRRRLHGRHEESIVGFLHDWERWAAELLESHLSYPSLAYFRSQHEHQSWLAALTAILDLCALLMVGLEGLPAGQAALTFAIARHAVVDLTQVLGASPREPRPERLPRTELARLRRALAAIGVALEDGPEAERRLAELRSSYEPFVYALGRRLLMDLPAWTPRGETLDAWETSAWNHDEGEQRAAGGRG